MRASGANTDPLHTNQAGNDNEQDSSRIVTTTNNNNAPTIAPEQAREPCPKKPREELSFIHCHDDVAKSTVSRAFAYLDKLAFEAETSTREVTSEIEELQELKSHVNEAIDVKIAELKSKAQRNLQTSLEKLRNLNGVFSAKQTLHQALKNTLSHIFIVSGTHILSVPHLVLVQIVGYLPRESILAVRSVCFDFWKAVCEATRRAVTLCTSVARQDNSWRLIDYNGACTPTADFVFSINAETTLFTLTFCVVKMKLHAQAKIFAIEITYSHNFLLAHAEYVISSTRQAELALNARSECIHLKYVNTPNMPLNSFTLRIEVTDYFDAHSRLCPSDLRKNTP
ncbi:hypothetical protein Pelo_18904 [Pelomyxa schiedti]|nr:hypothetical protein Pelo_18904 [Pelomyxa schiedti]